MNLIPPPSEGRHGIDAGIGRLYTAKRRGIETARDSKYILINNIFTSINRKPEESLRLIGISLACPNTSMSLHLIIADLINDKLIIYMAIIGE